MVVLTAPDARLAIGVCLRETGDVDEEAVPDVDPAGVDDILAVAALALPDPRVDVEEVSSSYFPVVGGIGVVCSVVSFTEVVESCAADLGVEIEIPG